MAVGQARPRTVLDAMVRGPKVLPADATVADVRALLADEHVHLALLVDGGRLVGTVSSRDLDGSAGPADPAARIATMDGRTVAPGVPLGPVRAEMIAASQRRLAVVDDDGRLLGLLCLKRAHTGFCSDRDLAAREDARRRR
jgi:CBS domain-containing protein